MSDVAALVVPDGPLFTASTFSGSQWPELRAHLRETLPQQPPEGWTAASYPTAQAYLSWYLLFGEHDLFPTRFDAYAKDLSRLETLDHMRYGDKFDKRWRSELKTKLLKEHTVFAGGDGPPRKTMEMLGRWLNPQRGYADLNALDRLFLRLGDSFALYNLDRRGWVSSSWISEEELQLRKRTVLIHPDGRFYSKGEMIVALFDASTPKAKIKGRREPRFDERRRQTELEKIPSRAVRFLECQEMLLEQLRLVNVLHKGDPERAAKLLQIIIERDEIPEALIYDLLEA